MRNASPSIGIGLLVMIAAAGSAALMTVMPAAWLLAVAGSLGLIVILASGRRSWLLPSLFAFAIFIYPDQGGPTGAINAYKAVGLAMILAALLHIATGRARRIFGLNGVWIAITLFLGAAVLSSLFNYPSLVNRPLVWAVFRGLCVVAIAILVQTQSDFFRVLRAFVAGAAVASVFAVGQQVLGLTPLRPELGNTGLARAVGTIGDPNILCLFVLPAAAVAWGLIETQRLSKLWGLVCMMLFLGAVAFSQSRSGAAAVGILLLAFVVAGSPRVRAASIAVGLVGLLVVSGMQVWNRSSEGSQLSDTSRLLLWRQALQQYSEHPILGIGPDMFRVKASEEVTAALRRKLFTGPAGRYQVANVKRLQAHNGFVEVAAELGTVGLIGFILLFTTSFRSFRRSRLEPRIVRGLVLALVLQVWFSISLSTEYSLVLWLTFGLGAAAIRLRPDPGEATVRVGSGVPIRSDAIPAI